MVCGERYEDHLQAEALALSKRIVVDLVLLALMGFSKKLLVLILVLDVFPQLLHFKDKNHKLLVLLLTFYNYTPTSLISKQ